MAITIYITGILFAISAGTANNTWLLIEKFLINKLPSDEKMMRKLVKKPLWIFAFFLRYVVSTILSMLAQITIGPALIPGLMSFGLVILTLGSIKLLGERLEKIEIFAIIILIIAILIIGLSGLRIGVYEINLVNLQFLLRIALYTIILISFSIILGIIQKKLNKFKSISFALISGLMYSLSTLWLGLLMGFIGHLFSETSNLAEIVLFAISAVLLVVTNYFGVTIMVKALRYGQASNLVPIQTIPTQVSPSFVYFFVFLLAPPNIISPWLFVIAIVFIIYSSFILSKKQAQIENIK